jgi:hypothetical protein
LKKPTLSSLRKKAWKLVSEYCRRREADEGGFVHCYTCSHPIHWKYEAQAGHAIGGRRNAVLFDDSIIRPQCYACNAKHIGNGRPHIFMTKLVLENGWDWWTVKVDEAKRAVKYTSSDLEDLIQSYKQKLESLA